MFEKENYCTLNGRKVQRRKNLKQVQHFWHLYTPFIASLTWRKMQKHCLFLPTPLLLWFLVFLKFSNPKFSLKRVSHVNYCIKQPKLCFRQKGLCGNIWPKCQQSLLHLNIWNVSSAAWQVTFSLHSISDTQFHSTSSSLWLQVQLSANAWVSQKQNTSGYEAQILSVRILYALEVLHICPWPCFSPHCLCTLHQGKGHVPTH